MTNKIGNGSIPLRIGRLIDATVYGGPYREVPVDFWGVKMAEEMRKREDANSPENRSISVFLRFSGLQ